MPSHVYNYTGAWQKFVVPKGVTQLSVSLDGASSGDVRGGRITGTLSADWVKPGAELFIYPGQRGQNHSGQTGGDPTDGWGGRGGTGTTRGGDSGGGASVIRRNAADGAVIAVAGGAGGSTGDTNNEQRTNLCINPSFEVNTVNFSSNTVFGGYDLGTFARSTSRFWVGTTSVACTTPITTKGSWYGWFSPSTTGRTYTFSVDVFVPTGSPDVRIDVLFSPNSGGYSPWVTTKDAWVRVTHTFVAHQTTTTQFYGLGTKPTTTGGGFWMDGGTLEEGGPTSYFDGSTTTAGWTNTWTGTAHASTSLSVKNTPPAADVNGRGGRGGGTTGEHGFPGTSGGPNPAGYANAAGGTQSQGGKGGNNSLGTQYDGGDAENSTLGRGGKGGNGKFGGGGGGGGYRSGGGGQASFNTVPGGGGGGGSSYTQGLTTSSSSQGGGAIGHGTITITWVTPGKDNLPPSTPTNVTIGGHAEVSGLVTHAVDQVQVCARVSDSNKGQAVRLVLRLSKSANMTPSITYYSDWTQQENKKGDDTVGVTICMMVDDLRVDTHYHGRLYAEDRDGHFSSNFNAIDFWTDRPPNAPTLISPEDNSQFPDVQNITFSWNFTDPDGDKGQGGYQLRFREVAPIGTVTNPWDTIQSAPHSTAEQYTVDASSGHFTPNNSYEWSVRTRDNQGYWGPWATPFRFALAGDTKSPTLISPIRDRAVPVDVPVEFQWKYNDPRPPYEPQHHADIRWRVVGTSAWTTTIGDASEPGSTQSWLFNAGAFTSGIHYEWQVRTYSSTAIASEWSTSGFFWSILTPGSSVVIEPLPSADSIPAPPLGCGDNRVYVYERGGDRLVGEINPATAIQWTRKRDDISTCDITTNGFGWDCGQMLKNLRSFQHEIVVFRDGVRVWEGPITRVAYYTDRVEIEARDVMTYVYRRILRQGYNDSYQVINGVQVGLRSVVERAADIIVNALAYDDPNMLAYLTIVSTNSDAQESRIVPAYSRTAWEEVDDLAATAGLDYVTVGRRVILWDTHNRIGLLPEMRDGDFSESPVVTEYGMNLCNYFAVTNNSGVWGSARPVGDSTGNHDPKYYGWVEQLASAYGENSGGGSSTTLTASAQAALVAKLEDQAKRNIAARWPGPVLVRVPDNATLNPEINVGINQLIPGVHIPLRASNTLRPIAQMQKLDSVTVTQDAQGEKVAVVMSPAPKAGQDFDADEAATEED